MPLVAYRAIARVMWALRLGESPPGQVEFAIHPWTVANDKLKGTGWTPRYTSRETFEITMRTHDKLPPAPPTPVRAEAPAEPAAAATLHAGSSRGR
jgi:hypothetical protein